MTDIVSINSGLSTIDLNHIVKKPEVLFENAALLISEFPEVGTQTDLDVVRVKVVQSYELFYLNMHDKILILRVWDSRQDPSEFRIR